VSKETPKEKENSKITKQKKTARKNSNKNKTEKKIDKNIKKLSEKIRDYEQDVFQLQEKLIQKEAEIAEAKDRYLRLVAEFDNFSKRSEKETKEIIEYAGEKVLKEILPIFDDLERAISNSDDKKCDGMKLIHKKFLKVLKDFHVEPIISVGEEFNPDFHHAVMAREEEGIEPDMVLEEYEKGYKYKKHILRYAKVVVSR